MFGPRATFPREGLPKGLATGGAGGMPGQRGKARVACTSLAGQGSGLARSGTFRTCPSSPPRVHSERHGLPTCCPQHRDLGCHFEARAKPGVPNVCRAQRHLPGMEDRVEWGAQNWSGPFSGNPNSSAESDPTRTLRACPDLSWACGQPVVRKSFPRPALCLGTEPCMPRALLRGPQEGCQACSGPRPRASRPSWGS